MTVRAALAAALVVIAAAGCGGGGDDTQARPAPPVDRAVQNAKHAVDAGRGLIGGFCPEELAADGSISPEAAAACLQRAYKAYERPGVPSHANPGAPAAKP